MFYKRYVDDGAILAKSREHAVELFDSIAQQDPDGRLEWEVDYPSEEESFTPFLSTQIRIDPKGIVHHKFYRKKQKKQITLHHLSHHSFQTKVETIKQFYKTAEASSSSPEYAEESRRKIDYLLQCNGYSNPRQYINYRIKSTGQKSNSGKQSSFDWRPKEYFTQVFHCQRVVGLAQVRRASDISIRFDDADENIFLSQVQRWNKKVNRVAVR